VTERGRPGAFPRPGAQPAQPDLDRFDGERLEAGRDYDSLLFADMDFTGQDAADARFLGCRFERCCVEGLSLRRARLIACSLVDLHAANLDAPDSIWRDCQMNGGRVGALVLAGTTWTSVRVSGARFGFLNLAEARIGDSVLEACVVGSLDLRAAQVRSLALADCAVEELNVTEATLSKLDLSGARVKGLIGVENLKGAIISRQQLFDLAPQLAAQIGVVVRPD
jgi:uncharacterized protein YjbI with pentapeptide repeats